MDQEQTICYCSQVTKAQIIEAIHHGAKTLDDIRQATSACTISNCKQMNPKKTCCSADILAILNEYV